MNSLWGDELLPLKMQRRNNHSQNELDCVNGVWMKWIATVLNHKYDTQIIILCLVLSAVANEHCWHTPLCSFSSDFQPRFKRPISPSQSVYFCFILHFIFFKSFWSLTNGLRVRQASHFSCRSPQRKPFYYSLLSLFIFLTILFCLTTLLRLPFIMPHRALPIAIRNKLLVWASAKTKHRLG